LEELGFEHGREVGKGAAVAGRLNV
jgi:hypothetical protein